MIDPDLIRWFNVALAGAATVLLTMGTVRRWHVTPPRLKRTLPWVIATYAVIAYGSGEIAASSVDFPVGLRVAMMLLVLFGLVGSLLYGINDDDYSR